MSNSESVDYEKWDRWGPLKDVVVERAFRVADRRDGVQFIDHAPRVLLVGQSTLNMDAMSSYLKYRGEEWVGADWFASDLAEYPEPIVEAAGRVCYQSWNNPAGKTTPEYIQTSILEHAHGSVLEHVWLNFMVADLPRSTQLELVRHGDGTAFSFESTRFTDRHLRFVIPPRYRDDPEAIEVWKVPVWASIDAYLSLVGGPENRDTLSKKRRKEAARSILPNCQGSDGMFSCNLRAFRWITELRSDPSADLSIREFAMNIYGAAAAVLDGVTSDSTLGVDDDGYPFVKYDNRKV